MNYASPGSRDQSAASAQVGELAARYRVPPGQGVDLGEWSTTAPTAGDRGAHRAELERHRQQLAAFQERFYAEGTRALLVVLQALDAGGKDGIVKHVMGGLNPAGVDVHSFKAPSSEERGHDHLWRHHKAAPAKGRIAIFNRSHYEEVLVVRVHPELLEVPESARGGLWERRFRQINDWERMLTESGTTIVKIHLHLSPLEQRRRFLRRLEEPEKHWKFAAGDIRDRRRWDDYRAAYDACLSATSTESAPWYVVPADDKPYARLVAGAVLLHVFERLDPRYPTMSQAQLAELAAARDELLAEVVAGDQPGGAPHE